MDQILQILIQNGYVDEAGAKDLADLAKTESKTVRQLVIDQGILDEDSLVAAMAAYQDTEAVDLGTMTIESEVTEAIPASTARMYNVFPIAADDSSVTLATFATGSTTADADALGDGEEDLWFVPFSYFKYFTAPGPLDSRDPTGMLLFLR